VTLRVVHVVPISHGGGTSGFIQRQIDKLAEAGVEGQVVYFSGSAMLSRPYLVLAGMTSIKRAISAFQPDIVHAHWGSLLALTTALASIGGPPLVITYRGSDINPVPSEPWLLSMTRIACSQLAIMRAAAIICVSDDLRRRLLLRNPLIQVIPSGTDLTLFKPMDKVAARKELNWPLDERVVFFYEGGRPEIKRRDLADAGLEEARKIIGPCRLEVMGSDIPHDRVPILLNASDCLLMTSDYEGSPNIIREALACRTPIVSVDVGDVRHWLTNLDGTIIVNRDPHEIGRAIADIITSGIRPATELKILQFSDEASRDAILKIYYQVSSRDSNH